MAQQPLEHWLCQHLHMSLSLMLPSLGGFGGESGVTHANELWIRARPNGLLEPGALWEAFARHVGGNQGAFHTCGFLAFKQR